MPVCHERSFPSQLSPDLEKDQERGGPETSQLRGLGRGQAGFALSVEGTVSLELGFLAMPDAAPGPLLRARLQSLSEGCQ